MNEGAAQSGHEVASPEPRVETPLTPSGETSDLVERVARAMYEGWPMTAISEALAELAGVELNAPISWERANEIGADLSGLRRYARAAIASLTSISSTEVRSLLASCRNAAEEALSAIPDAATILPEKVGELVERMRSEAETVRLSTKLTSSDHAHIYRSLLEGATTILSLQGEVESATEERDALLKAIGIKPGPLKDQLTRKVVLDDAGGLRSEMVKARRRIEEAEADAVVWRMIAGERVEEARSGLLKRIWDTMRGERRRAEAAEQEVERLKGYIAEQITHVLQRRQDGIEMGASIWRIALEDVVRENRTTLNPTAGDDASPNDGGERG